MDIGRFHAVAVRTRYQLLLIAVVGLLAYSNTFQAPFQFDDLPNIVDNPLIKNIGNFISSSKGYDFNPRRFAGYLSFAVNYHFGGLSVTGYHIVNLAIHITSAILVYLLVTLTFQTPFMSKEQRAENSMPSALRPMRLAALFSALLFVAHPIQTQAVTYIVQRLASLAAMFYLLSLITYIKARLALTTEFTEDSLNIKRPQEASRNARRFSLCSLWLILSFFSAVLAMKTKETAFTLPVIIILYEFTFFKSTLKKKLLFLTPILFTMLIIPISIMGTNRPLSEIISDLSDRFRLQTDLSRWDYLMTQMRVITTYVRLIFLPVNQSLDYNYPVYHSLFQLPVLLSFIFLASIFGTGIYMLQRAKSIEQIAKTKDQKGLYFTPYALCSLRLIGFGILWFFMTLSVESSIIPIADVIFEHRLYLPSAGAFIAVAASAFIIPLRDRSGQTKIEKAVVIVLSLIIIVLAGATYARNILWQDRVRLWEDVVRKSPGDLRAHNNLVAELTEKRLYDKALKECRISLLMKPDNVEGHYNLGVIYQALHMFAPSVEQYQEVIKLAPDYAWAHLNLGVVYSQAFDQSDKAEKEFLTAVNLMPDLEEAHFNLGCAYLRKGEKEKARRELAAALKIRPDNAKIRQLLKACY